MASFETETDFALVEAARGGHPGAADAIYDRYGDKIHRYIFFKVHDDDDARDLLQDVFFRFYRSGLYAVVVDDRGLGPYLHRAAHNRVVDHFRETARDPSRLPITLQTVPADDSSLDHAFDNYRLKAALDRLPDIQRDCLEMRYGLDMSTTEIAEVMGVTDRAVRRYLALGYDALAPVLRETEEPTHGRD